MGCPVCGSADTTRIYSGTDKVLSKFSRQAALTLTLCECRGCGMQFLDKIAYDMKDVHDSYWDMMARNMGDDYSHYDDTPGHYALLHRLAGYKKTGKLLEIGCGSGKFLQVAREMGWNVTGVEISQKAAEIAVSRFQLNILNGSLEQVRERLSPSQFDAVVMWGVIEHLKEPLATLHIARQLLRSGGMLAIYTPSADSIFHKGAKTIYRLTRGKVTFPMERVITSMHAMYFTSDTITNALSRCLFSVKSVQMGDIDLDFVFKAHGDLWWSNKMFLACAKLLQQISHFHSMHSHMLVFAEPS